MADLPVKAILNGHALFSEFNGALTENFVVQEMMIARQRLHYWTSQNRAEVDVVFRYDEAIIPLEIKSGRSSRKKSLQVYRDKYKPRLALCTSPMNLKQQGGVLICHCI